MPPGIRGSLSCSQSNKVSTATLIGSNESVALHNHTTTDHREGEQLEDRRSVGASSCNSGDGTDQRV